MQSRRLNAAVLAALPALAVSSSLYYCGNALADTLYYNPTIATNWGALNWSTTGDADTFTQGWTDGDDAVFSDSTQQSITVDANYAPNSVQNASPTSGEALILNGPGTTTLTTTAFVNQSSTYTTWFDIDNISLGGNAFTVSGYRPGLEFNASNASVTPYDGTITFNASGGTGTFYLSSGAAPLSGMNTNVVVQGAGEYIVPGHSVTIGSLSDASATCQIFASGSNDPTLTVFESTNTTFAGSFNSASTTPVTFALQGTATLSMTRASGLTNVYDPILIQGGNLQVAAANAEGTTSTYQTITISNGGTLSTAATADDLIGNGGQTYSNGTFAGPNNNGFLVTTQGSTSYIDPSGFKFGITELNAAAGGAEAFNNIADLLSVYSLTTADTDAGNFVIDSSGLTGFTPGVAYNVLQWMDYTPLTAGDTGDFTAIAPAGYTASLDISGDDLQVTFTAVPEPATAAILLLGGVPLMCRRRRTQVESA